MISFCSNIFPAQTWSETRSMLLENLPLVRQELEAMNSPLAQEVLGLGLWLSALGVHELCDAPEELLWLQIFLRENRFVVETMNGFPYGDFHGERVKEQVFLPDWSSPERLTYTCMLFELLAQLAPSGTYPLCVSTLPGSYSGFTVSKEAIFARLEAVAGFLARLSAEFGRDFILALEPEPFGLFDDTLGCINFMNELRNYARRPHLVERFIGVTYDTCHFAVMGEEPRAVFDAFVQHNIRVAKIQWSHAVTLSAKSIDDVKLLAEYDEPRYFHQTRVHYPQGEEKLYVDLSSALQRVQLNPAVSFPSEWVAHFHVPLHAQFAFPLGATTQAVRQTLDALTILAECPQFEVETYTWGVLPPEQRQSLPMQIAGEMSYLNQILA